MGFRSLQRSRNRRSTARGLAAPATFRPQGLATLSTAYSLRGRAGLISYRRRSWDSPFGAFSSSEVSGASPPGRTHVPFFLPLLPSPKRRAGPAGRGFWALTLAGVPGARSGVSAPDAGCSHGFSPLQGNPAEAWTGISPGLLPRAWPAASRSAAPRSLAQLRPGPTGASGSRTRSAERPS
jgi:hypothetical protein